MKQEIIDLKENNSGLNRKIKELEENGSLFKEKIDDLQTDNSALKTRIEELSMAVNNLSDSENAIRVLVADLTAKIQSGADKEMIAQINNLERLQSQTRNEFERLVERLNILESSSKQSSTSGIFSYFDRDEYQTMFIEKVEEALKQEMTYAQIDDYLSRILPPDLDKIIKDHPALTRNYIRSLRRD
jgi:chromosome segregation ATPase